MATILYCKNRENKTVKVWLFSYDMSTNQREFYKNAPHLFGVSGALQDLGFKAYATQKKVFVKQGRKKKEYDMLELFEKYGDAKVVILDKERGQKLTSLASDWVLNGVVKDYGDGDQLFLDVKYMKVIDYLL